MKSDKTFWITLTSVTYLILEAPDQLEGYMRKILRLPTFIFPSRTHITAISCFNQIIRYFQILYTTESIFSWEYYNSQAMQLDAHITTHFFLKPAENNSALQRQVQKTDASSTHISALAENEDSQFGETKSKCM